MNNNLSGRRLDTLSSPADAVLFFESVSIGPDAADALASVPKAPADGGRDVVIIYADGHGYVYPAAAWWQQSSNPTWHNRLLGR